MVPYIHPRYWLLASIGVLLLLFASERLLPIAQAQPDAPSSITFHGNNTHTIVWGDVTGALNYEVNWRTDTCSTWSTHETDHKTFSHNTGVAATSYLEARARASNNSGWSGYSEVVNTRKISPPTPGTPSAPTISSDATTGTLDAATTIVNKEDGSTDTISY